MDVPIIDTHFHVFLRSRKPNEGLLSADVLQRDFSMADYRAAIGSRPVNAAIGVQVVHQQFGLPELAFMRQAARADPLMNAYIAWLPVDDPESWPFIGDFAADPFVVGVRYSEILGPDGQPRRAGTAVEGARRLGAAGLVYDISVRPSQYEGLGRLAEAVPETTFVLGHMGKPDMRGAPEAEWLAGLRKLARQPNILCKMSAHVLTRDDPPYVRAEIIERVRWAADCFGPERLIFGSNYPTCLISSTICEWIDILDEALSGSSAAEKSALYAGNATKVYRLPAG